MSHSHERDPRASTLYEYSSTLYVGTTDSKIEHTVLQTIIFHRFGLKEKIAFIAVVICINANSYLHAARSTDES